MENSNTYSNTYSKTSFRSFFIIIWYLIFGQFLFGQSIRIENTQINVSQNTILSTVNNVINNGTITNNGSFYLSGNWNNNGVYNEAQGNVFLNGENSQFINHNNQNFFNLVTTGSDKFIESDITINGTLTLREGIVRPINNAILLIDENAVINEASEISYINGALYYTGAGDKPYPIGKNGNYCPVELLSIQGTNPVIGLEVFEPNPEPQSGPGIDQVSTERYWQKTLLFGSYERAFISIDCSLHPPDNLQNTVIAQSNDVGGVFSSIGNRNATGGSLPGFIVSETPFTDNIFSLAELGDISIKNVITPNNDGVNDFLYIANIDRYPDNEIIIINRAGNIVYSEKGYNNTWNAIVNDKILPTGSYICILKLGHSEKIYKQAITILR